MKRATIYARISQDRDSGTTREGAGVARQEADARALAERRGWEVVDLVVENDTSAAGTKKRPGFERMLESVESGAADVVVAWSLDRLTRNRRDTVRLIETCQKRGALIALVRGSDLDMATPAGRLTADLLAAVARSEIEVKSDRQLRANRQAAEAGRWSGGRRAFGYEGDGMTVREDEAAAVRDAYQWLLDGVSLRQIAHRWNARGFTTPQGKRTGEPLLWDGATVSRCLRKPRYAALRAHRGEVVGPAQWPALVDAETWHAAQAVMRDPRRRPQRGDKRLLTSVALCGLCGASVWSGGGATARGVYACRASRHLSRKREPVDAYVSAVMIERLRRPDALAALAGSQKPEEGPSVADLIRQADDLRQRLDGLAEAYSDGAVTLSQLRKGSDRIKAQIAELEGKMYRGDSTGEAVRALASAPDVAAAWDGLTRETQRAIIDRLAVVTLYSPGRGVRTFDPDTVRIEWRTA